MPKPHKRRSEREKKPDYEPIARIGSVDPRLAVTSVEFQTAYARYLDEYPTWINKPPLPAQSWRSLAIAEFVG